MVELYSLRKQIECVDRLIIGLLAERMKVVEKVGRFKKRNNLSFLNVAQWNKTAISRNKLAKKFGLDTGMVKDIWSIIHKQALKVEKSS